MPDQRRQGIYHRAEPDFLSTWTNLIVFLGNFIGAFGGSIGAILLLFAARVLLKKQSQEKRLAA